MVSLSPTASACLDAGKCVVTSTTQYYASIGVFVALGITLLLLLAFVMFTPAFTFLRAKIRHKALTLMVNRSQRGIFLPTDISSEGLGEIKKVGTLLITEKSHIMEQKSGIPLFVSFGEFASTLPLSYPYLIQKLRQMGFQITNVDDLKFLIDGWKKEKDSIPNEVQEVLKKLEVAIRPYETIKIHDLAYTFPFNVTPAMLESKLQHQLSLKLQLWNKILNPQMIMMIIALMMGGTICAIIAYKFLTQGNTSCTVHLVQSGLQTIQSNISGVSA